VSEQPFNAPRILGPNGRDLASSREAPAVCPRCGAGKKQRCASGGFGTPHTVCSGCGYDFIDVPWEAPR